MGVVSPPNGLVPGAALEQYLRELSHCLVLRNEGDLFGNLQRGGDVDLLVEDLELAERTLIRLLGCPIRVTRRSYVREYFYDWGNVDLLPSIEWRGARYLRTEAVIDDRQTSERKRPVPRIAHEASISWLTNILFGGFFKERYAADIRKAVEIDGIAFRQTLKEVAGKKWGGRLWHAAVDGHAEISAEWTRSLRLAVWWRAFVRSPVGTIQRYLAFVIGELRLRFRPPVPWIAILGSDCGRKSSLTNEIVHRFAACPYAKVKAFHWAPRLMARAQRADGLRLLVLAADWLVGYWTRLVHLRAKGYILAFDQTYFDLVSEQKRYQDGARSPLAGAFRWMLPTPDLVFVVDSDLDMHRALVRQQPTRHALDGSLPLNVLVDEVQRVIRAWMLDRSVASLDGVQAPAITAPTGRL